MERIFFFTTKAKLKDVNVSLDFNLDNSQNSILYKDFHFPNDKMISLIADGIPVQSMENILNACPNTTSIFYVFHQDTSKEALARIKAYCSEKEISLTGVQDIHQKGKSKFYHLVKDFCKTDSKLTVDFFDDLKKKFNHDEVLEKKLALLHDCLHHQSAAKADTSWLTQDERDIVEFLAKQKDNLKKEYIDALTELRKKLLGS